METSSAQSEAFQNKCNDRNKERYCDKETIDLAYLGTQIVLISSYVIFCVLLFIIVT